MDPTSNNAPGMSFSQPPGGQDSSVMPDNAARVVVGATPQAQTALPAMPMVTDDSASDADLDQAWITKAKDIVEQTKADPFTQSKELNRIKAEYLKTRFNKELNVGSKPSQ